MKPDHPEARLTGIDLEGVEEFVDLLEHSEVPTVLPEFFVLAERDVGAQEDLGHGLNLPRCPSTQ